MPFTRTAKGTDSAKSSGTTLAVSSVAMDPQDAVHLHVTGGPLPFVSAPGFRTWSPGADLRALELESALRTFGIGAAPRALELESALRAIEINAAPRKLEVESTSRTVAISPDPRTEERTK